MGQLPPELIAQTAAEPRDGSRLMMLRKHSGAIEHAVFRDIARYRTRGAITLERINDESALSSALVPQLERAGFRRDYRYLRITADA